MRPTWKPALAFASMAVLSLAATDNWPQFRGPQSTGVADDPNLPDAVWGDRIFVTSVVSTVAPESPKKGLYFGGNRENIPADEHRWMVYAIDWKTGKIAWEREVYRGAPRSSHHLKNTYASETPVTDGERVYAYFGNLVRVARTGSTSRINKIH